MSAGNYNITINKGADFSRTFSVSEESVTTDLTDHSIAATLKENFKSTDSVDFTVTITDAVQGLFKIVLTDVTTLSMDPGEWRYDIVMTDAAGDKTRLLEGIAFVKEGVTT